MEKDKNEINNITDQFFDVFTTSDNRSPNVQKIRELFLPEGILINNTSEEPLVYTIESFIKPRERMLTNGTLNNFKEKELSHTTAIYGNLAQRMSIYKKSGELHGELFQEEGIKLMQFIKMNDKWFFSSVCWSDKM